MIQISKTKAIDSILKEFSPLSHILIDVRSESEFAEDHILGSVNLPVLNDKERAEVGTEYKQNPFTARQLGAKLIAGNLKKNLERVEELINEFNAGSVEKHKPFCHFIIYCWRGGMRSRSLFTVMDLIGYKTSLIDGGYQAYRRYVNQYFQEGNLPEAISIYGPSGSGKSQLISGLMNAQFPAIHLEKYANHKGSLLGGEPSGQPSQKLFESYLYEAIQKVNSNYLIVEGESKKIGRLLLPEKFYSKMITGKKIWVELPLEVRAERLAEEYNNSDEFVLDKLQYLKRFIDGKIYSSITEAIAAKDRYTAALLLLKHHYDSHYLKGSPDKVSAREYSKIFKADSFQKMEEEVLDYFTHLT
jgi:tRNA 2-selenouridine synthase